MSAVIESGGKQYLVNVGDKIQIEKIPAELGQEINFDKVLLLESNQDVEVGKPYISGAVVKAKVIGMGKGKKIHVLKYKSKSKYRRKIGHRQEFVEVEIVKL